jgi:ribosomal protein S18 acetylase RimI-like enzyme
MSAIRLRPLREDEFETWRVRSRERYAADMVANAGMSPAAAAAKAERDGTTALPQGLATPGHHLFAIEDEAGAEVGTLWFAATAQHAWLYEIEVEETRRGEGFGRAAMEELEARGRALGLDRIELNVFGGNTVARALYRSLGYDETFVTMAKRLTDSPAEGPAPTTP